MVLVAVARLDRWFRADRDVAAPADGRPDDERGQREHDGEGGQESVAGVTGLVLAATAYYAAFGFELEDAKRKTVIPLLRRGPARTALHGDVADQLDGVAHEAGVREQL